jgi:hypothetical protein
MEKSLPITELRHLLYTVAEHGGQHLSEVEADLHHTSFLLGEAIEKLGVSFMAVHEAVMEQQQYLDKMIETHALPEAIKADIQKYRQHIGNEVDRVVTGLQFHDLTTQLNARTVKRVNGLRHLFTQLLTEWDEMATEFKYEDKTIAALLTKMSESLGNGSVALEGGLRQPVKQQDMACGDIDLF